ncbi:Stp1/IreP family PP2C-type Ser/Thr phosphatase [Eubacterium ramulus]|uniref:Stp1/IreP family PP2C-type Ser/Thr phosphatase n=1 Tax=uncultured Eubacterium sp. TaxID=165185 RepID=UPI00259A3D6B|nr:Stp1/IreP family PP2C-type Ser/Thr phosphatase [uncultured Eubacterium sp.]
MKISSLTDIGNTREMNQDYLYSSEESVGKLPNLFLVADGMGGHKAGEFASRYVVEHIVRSIKGSKEEEAVAILSESIETANRKLKEYADAHQQMRGMGTTIVAAVIQGRTLIVANVGDSRLYIVGDEITQVTQDHSLVQEMVRLGEMDPQSAKNHPDKNIITRAVGVSEKVKIDIFERQLRAGEYIILCSDGLTNMVEDSVILQILHGAGSLSDKAERLIELANKNGGKDNITVIIIEPNSDEVAEC